MSAIGSLVFCTACGNLLPASKGSAKNLLLCRCCGAENPGKLPQNHFSADLVAICFGISTYSVIRYRCYPRDCHRVQTFRFPFALAPKAAIECTGSQAARDPDWGYDRSNVWEVWQNRGHVLDGTNS